MQPLLTIARTHFRLVTTHGGTLWLAAALLLVTAASAWLNWQRTEVDAAARAITQRSAREQWERQGSKDPHAAAHFGMYAVKPLSVWEWFDPGIDPYLGTAVFMEAHKQDPPTASRLERREWQRLLTVPTPAAILQLLLPMLAVLCGFSAFAEDRETGILRQVLSTGLSPVVLGAGKILGSAGALLALAVPALLAVSVIAWIVRAPVQVALPLLCAYALYAAIFLLAAVAISARSATSQSALTLALSLWLVWCVLLPRIAADGAARLIPVPTFADFWQQIAADQAQGVDGHDSRNARTEALRQQVLRQYGVDRIEDLPVSFRGLSLQAGEEYGNRVFDHRYAALRDIYSRHESVQFALSLGSPLLALRNLSLAAAGTGMDEYYRFAGVAERFRRQMVRTLNSEVAATRPGDKVERDTRLWSRIGEFRYEASASSPASAAWILAAWLAIGALGAARSLRGMRP